MHGLRRYRLCLPLLLITCSAPAFADLTLLLPENATYRYVNATAATTIGAPADWFEYDFDDSTWFTGPGAFSGSFGGDLPNYFGTPKFPNGTAWSVNFDPFLRTEFLLVAPIDLTIWIAVDNGIIDMYLNGVLATANVNLEGTANRWEHVFDVPAAYTYAGTNVLALQLEDHGGATGFAMIVTSDDAADQPDFTNNPPPPPLPNGEVPEPSTVILCLAGLVMLGLRKRSAVRALQTAPVRQDR